MSPTRRTSLIAAGSAATALLAGCLGTFETDDGDTDDEEETDETSPETDGEDETDVKDESGPEAAVEAFLEAAASEDTDAIAEAAHPDSFLHPEGNGEFEYQFGADGESEIDGVDDLERFETEVLVEDAGADDVRDLEGTAFLFGEGELAELVEAEEIALVRSEAEHPDPDAGNALVTETAVWMVVTEDDEWRVFWSVTEEESVDDPEEAFDEPVIDEDGDVVAEIDWEYDQDTDGNGSDGADDGFEWDVEWAQVRLTDSPGRDAETVRVESTIAGSTFEFYGEGSNAWAGSWANVSLDPDGDQIVVTAIGDGEEDVVHRERYVP